MNRCVIIGGADIADYGRIRRSLRSSDFCIYCDSGLNHEEGIGMKPNLIVGDFDSHEQPATDAETIVLPCEKMIRIRFLPSGKLLGTDSRISC